MIIIDGKNKKPPSGGFFVLRTVFRFSAAACAAVGMKGHGGFISGLSEIMEYIIDIGEGVLYSINRRCLYCMRLFVIIVYNIQ